MIHNILFRYFYYGCTIILELFSWFEVTIRIFVLVVFTVVVLPGATLIRFGPKKYRETYVNWEKDV